MFKVYWDLFGICTKFPKKSLDNDAQQRIKTFNHFKRRICDFLLLDSKYVFDESIKYQFGR